MEWHKIVTIVLAAAFVFVLFFTDKIKMLSIFKGVKTLFLKYDNGKVSGVSVISILSFVVLPLVLSFFLFFSFNFYLNKEVSNAILTFFSIIFTILFGSITLINATKEKENKIEEEVAKQTFYFIVWLLILSVVLIVLLIVYIFFIEDASEKYLVLYKCFSSIVVSIGIHVVLLILVVIKRTLRLFEAEKQKSDK